MHSKGWVGRNALVEEVEKEVASYPFVAHALSVANDALVGVVDFSAFVDVAQHPAFSVAYGAIGEDVANALVVGVVDLQPFDEPDLLVVLIANHAIAVEETDGL